MRRYASAIIMLVVLCSLAVSGRAMIAEKDDIPDLPSMSPEGFEPLRASVIDPNPSSFTIDVRKFANIGVNEDAPDFAIYTTNNLPSKCGDFRDLELRYSKHNKYKLTMNLMGHEKVFRALKGYGCIILHNQKIEG